MNSRHFTPALIGIIFMAGMGVEKLLGAIQPRVIQVEITKPLTAKIDFEQELPMIGEIQ